MHVKFAACMMLACSIPSPNTVYSSQQAFITHSFLTRCDACLQLTMGPDGPMTTQDAGEPTGTSTSTESQEAFDDALQRLPSKQQQLERDARAFFLSHNKSIAKDGQGRDQRFVHKGEIDPNKLDSVDGYISDDDCVAVLYDITPGGPKRQKKQFRVYYGNVAKVTYDKVGKRVPGPRAHLTEKSGEAVCKWFDEKVDKAGKHIRYGGKRAYHLTLNNPTGFNDKVEFPNILTGVRMHLDTEHDCWLLDQSDYHYAETQMQKWSAYQNGTQASRNRAGEWVKDIRECHDKLKTKVCSELGIDF